MQDSFDLPQDYFAQLPRDLRIDVCFAFLSFFFFFGTFFIQICGGIFFSWNWLLFCLIIVSLGTVKLNDAAFDLSSGPVIDEVSYFYCFLKML